MPAFQQYSMVRVSALLRDVKHYDDWHLNRRSPAVGDSGTVVEILSTDGTEGYVVEAVDADGGTAWLGIFLAEELEPQGAER